jgi:hypothetical protein
MNQRTTKEDGPKDLSLDEYHRALIEEGIRQTDASEVIDHQSLMMKAAGWARKPRAR